MTNPKKYDGNFIGVKVGKVALDRLTALRNTGVGIVPLSTVLRAVIDAGLGVLEARK